MGSLLIAIVLGILAPTITAALLAYTAKNSRKKEAAMDSVDFVVRESKILLIFGFLLVLVGGGIVSAEIYLIPAGFWDFVESTSIAMSIIMYLAFAFLAALVFFVFFVFGGYAIYTYYHKRLVVMGNQMIYYPNFKKRRCIELIEVKKVIEWPAGHGIKAIEALTKNNVRLFHFDSTNPGYGLIVKKLKDSGIPYEVVPTKSYL